jgi:hypothetical protein
VISADHGVFKGATRSAGEKLCGGREVAPACIGFSREESTLKHLAERVAELTRQSPLRVFADV